MKQKTKSSIGCLLTALSLVVVSGCAYHERTVYSDGSVVETDQVIVANAPPTPVVEETVVAPGPGYIWIGGSWAWNGRWTWQQGHWARPPYAGAVWVPNRYAYRNGVHVYYRGYWRR